MAIQHDRSFAAHLMSKPRPARSSTARLLSWGILIFAAFLVWKYDVCNTVLESDTQEIEEILPLSPHTALDNPGCPQVAPLSPITHVNLDASLDRIYATDGFRHETYQKLGAAIRIPSVIFTGRL